MDTSRFSELAFSPKKIGKGHTILKNVFIKSATYEGMYQDGLPTQDLFNHHINIIKGGVALTTISYGAVSPNGRTFDSQMVINDRSLDKLQLLVKEVHDLKGKLSIQLTHCGFFTKNKTKSLPLAPSKVFNAYGFLNGIPFSKAMARKDMDIISKDFALAALKLKKIGLDSVEIHLGHGYLLSQFLSPLTNKRKDNYGGSIENRARFPLEVVSQVIKMVGARFPVLVKLNLDDGIEGGFSLQECKFVAKKLERIGCAAIILSGGLTSKSPFYLMRGKVPLWAMIKNAATFAEKLSMALFGPFLVKQYKYDTNFFLSKAKEIRKEVKIPLVYVGGVDSKEGIQEILEAGFDFIAIARALIYNPNFVQHLKEEIINKSGCTRCNQCIIEMDKNGVKCVLN